MADFICSQAEYSEISASVSESEPEDASPISGLLKDSDEPSSESDYSSHRASSEERWIDEFDEELPKQLVPPVKKIPIVQHVAYLPERASDVDIIFESHIVEEERREDLPVGDYMDHVFYKEDKSHLVRNGKMRAPDQTKENWERLQKQHLRQRYPIKMVLLPGMYYNDSASVVTALNGNTLELIQETTEPTQGKNKRRKRRTTTTKTHNGIHRPNLPCVPNKTARQREAKVMVRKAFKQTQLFKEHDTPRQGSSKWALQQPKRRRIRSEDESDEWPTPLKLERSIDHLDQERKQKRITEKKGKPLNFNIIKGKALNREFESHVDPKVKAGRVGDDDECCIVEVVNKVKAGAVVEEKNVVEKTQQVNLTPTMNENHHATSSSNSGGSVVKSTEFSILTTSKADSDNELFGSELNDSESELDEEQILVLASIKQEIKEASEKSEILSQSFDEDARKRLDLVAKIDSAECPIQAFHEIFNKSYPNITQLPVIEEQYTQKYPADHRDEANCSVACDPIMDSFMLMPLNKMLHGVCKSTESHCEPADRPQLVRQKAMRESIKNPDARVGDISCFIDELDDDLQISIYKHAGLCKYQQVPFSPSQFQSFLQVGGKILNATTRIGLRKKLERNLSKVKVNLEKIKKSMDYVRRQSRKYLPSDAEFKNAQAAMRVYASDLHACLELQNQHYKEYTDELQIVDLNDKVISLYVYKTDTESICMRITK